MRILFITPMFPNKHNIQQGIFVWEMAKQMQSESHDVRVASIEPVLCWPFNKMKKYRRQVASDALPDYDPIIRYQVSQFPRSIGMISMCECWSKILKRKITETWPDWKPDIIQSHTLVPGAVIGEAIRDIWDVPHVITSHGADTRVQIKRQRARSVITELLSKDVYVVGVGQTIVESLKKLTKQKDRITCIFNGMDVEKIRPASLDLQRRFYGRKIILGMGNLIKTKGFDYLLKGFASLAAEYPQWDITIVGGGTEKENLTNLIKELSLINRIHFTGPLSREQAMVWMGLCDIFCLPSWSEGFGVVYIEAMASGKPIIGVSGQGIDPVIRNNDIGLLIQPKSSEAVTNALKKLIIDEDLRRKMGKAAQQLALKDFTWNAAVRNYLELYNKILQCRSRCKLRCSGICNIPEE